MIRSPGHLNVTFLRATTFRSAAFWRISSKIGLSAVLCVMLWPSVSQAAQVKDMSIRFTVQLKQPGKQPERGFHILELECWSGECSLTTISMNQCMADNGGFSPVVDRTTTREGNLKVIDTGKYLQIEEKSVDIGGRSTITFRIGYKTERGRVKIASVSGGFVKNSAVLKRVITADYVPVRSGRTSGSRLMSLDCPVLVPTY